ncbi:hypothetical protein FRC02_001383 [Tulasnella sp. 418]|nr:hypothetical protein FRC02_001383 [Tulasnella sp. 418]
MLFTPLVIFLLQAALSLALPIINRQLDEVIRSPVKTRQDGGSQPKKVFAHMMVGNVYSYTVEDWKEDILLAHGASIDAFALNVGSDSWQPSRVADAYEAAKQLHQEDPSVDFKLFLSFDMAVLPGNSPKDAELLRKYITDFYDHPQQFKYQGKSFASTFAGQDSTFGAGSAEEGWKREFRNKLPPIHFVPAFFTDPNRMAAFEATNGYFDWDGGWPVAATKNPNRSGLIAGIIDSVKETLGSIDPDKRFIDALIATPEPKTYMACASPWFYTHYGPDTFNKNWVFKSDSHLYAKRWETLIENRDSVDLVEIVTWNDFGESSYIGKIKGDQPNSQAWVNGFSHLAWLDQTEYYAKAFKTGTFPEIDKDQLFITARPHPKNADAPDPVGKPDGFDLMEDNMYTLVFAKAPAKVTLSTSDSNKKSFQVEAGVTKLEIPLVVGGHIKATLTRDGDPPLEVVGEGFEYTNNPETYNYNAFVAGAKSS